MSRIFIKAQRATNENNDCYLCPKGEYQMMTIKNYPSGDSLNWNLYFYCYNHFRGQEVVECDPEMGWQQKENFAKCLVDVAFNKIALSSTSR